MDVLGKVYLGIAAAAIVGAILGYWLLSKKGPRGALLFVAALLYVAGMQVGNAPQDPPVREIKALGGVLQLTGFIGIVLGIIDLVRRKPATRAASEDQHVADRPDARGAAAPLGHCPHCDMSVAPSPNGTCPECGRPMTD
jgi:hypothetical protein